MLRHRLKKVGNEYVVTIPTAKVEQHGWQEGQLVGVQVTAIEARPAIDPELQQIVDELLDEHEDALRYLADR